MSDVSELLNLREALRQAEAERDQLREALQVANEALAAWGAFASRTGLTPADSGRAREALRGTTP